MEIINNISKTLKDDLAIELKADSHISIAACCFSMYAYSELKKQFETVSELRFMFTSPAFLAEKPEPKQREFYIPRLNREKSLFGSEFEVKLRNELTQKAIARECAEWIKRKVKFRSNTTNDNKLQTLFSLIKEKIENSLNPGNKKILVFSAFADSGEGICDHLSPKELLDAMQLLCKGKTTPLDDLCRAFNHETKDGKNMKKYSKLHCDAINSIVDVKGEKEIDSFLGGESMSFMSNKISGLDDFELICFLVVM
jgi:SNF2 family DNA or RNA helicase